MFSIPILIFAATILTSSSIYHLTNILFSQFTALVRKSDSHFLAYILSHFIAGEQDLVNSNPISEGFERFSEQYFPFQSSNPGTALHSTRHSRRSSISSDGSACHGGRNYRSLARPSVPRAAQSAQVLPGAYRQFFTNNGILDSARTDDGMEWEDVNENYDHPTEQRQGLLNNLTRPQDPRHSSSPSLRSTFFAGQYEGDVNGVLPTGPRLQFDRLPRPRRVSVGSVTSAAFDRT